MPRVAKVKFRSPKKGRGKRNSSGRPPSATQVQRRKRQREIKVIDNALVDHALLRDGEHNYLHQTSNNNSHESEDVGYKIGNKIGEYNYTSEFEQNDPSFESGPDTDRKVSKLDKAARRSGFVSAAMHSPTMRASPRRLPGLKFARPPGWDTQKQAKHYVTLRNSVPKEDFPRHLADGIQHLEDYERVRSPTSPPLDQGLHQRLPYTSTKSITQQEAIAQYHELLQKVHALSQAERLRKEMQMTPGSHGDIRDDDGFGEEEALLGRGESAGATSNRAPHPSELEDLPFGHLAFHHLSCEPAEEIDLRHWREEISDDTLCRLLSCTLACRVLDIRGAKLISDVGLIRAVGFCPHLEILRIAGCERLTDDGIESALNICGHNLAELDLAKFASPPLQHEDSLSGMSTELWCNCCQGPRLRCADQPRNELFRSGERSTSLKISTKALYCLAQICIRLEVLVLREQHEAVTNDTMIAIASSCGDLRLIDVGECDRLGQETMKALGRKCGPKLQDVRVSKCKYINDQGLRSLIGKAFHLRCIDLSDLQKISDDGVRIFMDSKTMWGHIEHPGFHNVHAVYLRNCHELTDISLGWIASGCSQLETLDVQGCENLGDFGLRSIGGLNHLKTLNMQGCDGISDSGILQLVSNAKVEFGLEALPELHTVILSRCSRISEKGLLALVQTLSGSLSRLEVCYTGRISDDFIRHLALLSNNRLRCLRLSGHNNITAAGIGALGQRCKYLGELDVDCCEGFANDSLVSLQVLRHVHSLNLSYCPQLQGVLAVPNWKLQVLSLRACTALDDGALLTLLGLCQELRTIDLSECTNLTSRAFSSILRRRKEMPPNLDMLNIKSCPHVSDAIMKEIASAWRTSGLECEFVNADRFRGIRPNLAYQMALHSKNQVEAKRNATLASIMIQCRVRQRQAYQKLLILRREDYMRRTTAATQIQRIGRGFLARTFYYELRHVLNFLALRTQYLYRQYRIAKITKRALAIWKSRTISRAFFAWYENAQAQIDERRTEAIRKLVQQAADFFANTLLKNSWASWQNHVVHRRWKKVQYPKADAFYTERATCRYFDLWIDNARPGILRRKNLVKIFLLCLPLEVRNAQVSRSNIYAASRFYRRTQRSYAFSAWFQIVLQARENIKLADQLCYKHFLAKPHGPAHEILTYWRRFTVYKMEIKEKERVLRSHIVTMRQARVVAHLAYLAGRRALHVKQTAVARTLFSAQESRKAFRRWIEYQHELREAKAKAQRALAFMRNASLVRSLHAWRQAIEIRKTYDVKIERSIARMLQRYVAKCFHTWNYVVRQQRAFKERSLRRIASRRLAHVLDCWKDFVTEHRIRRQSQLQSWYLLNKTVVRIQARWRGVLGREQIEDMRLLKQFMAIKIQQFCRIVLAKKRAFRAERMKILRLYISEEHERDLMAYEDMVAQDMQKEFKAARLVQQNFRARHARDMVYFAKRELARQKEIKRREHQHQLLLEHEAKMEERRLEQEKKDHLTSKIQGVVRGMIARKRYMVVWARAYMDRQATKIQSISRLRAALHKLAAERRWNALIKQTAKQQRTNARILRAMRLKNRSQQKMAMVPLDMLGIHPDTFTLDLNQLRKEVMYDFRDWTRFARSQFDAYRRAGMNTSQRQEIIRAFYERVKDEQWITKGNAIKIVSKQSPYRGETGYVLNVQEVSTVPGGAQASIRLDRTGTIILLPLMTTPTASEDSVSSMIRVKKMDKDFAKTKLTPELVHSNREALIEYAEGLKEETKQRRAALLIQRHFRGKKFRKYFKEAYAKQVEIDKAKQEKLLKLLRKLGLENARTGRLLVALGLVWPRYVPEMPDKPFAVETWAKKRQMYYEMWNYRRFQVLLARDERKLRVRDLKKKFKKDEDFAEDSEELTKPTLLLQNGESRPGTNMSVREPNSVTHIPADVIDEAGGGGGVEANNTSIVALEVPSLPDTHVSLFRRSLLDSLLAAEGHMSEEQEAVMPWRIRNPFKAAFWRGVYAMTDLALAPAAEAILIKSQKKREKGEIPLAILLQILAKAVGGPQWRQSPIKRLTWVGVYNFDQLHESCHVTMGGAAVFHGTWNTRGVPHGLGFLELPEGRGLERIREKYAIYLLPNKDDDEESEMYRSLMASRKQLRHDKWVEKTRHKIREVSRSLNEISKNTDEEKKEESDDDDGEEYQTDTDDEIVADPEYIGRKGISGRLQMREDIVASESAPSTPSMTMRQNSDDSFRIFGDATGPNDLLYVTIAAKVNNGEIVGNVKIHFKTGDTYEGGYFGEKKHAWLDASRASVDFVKLAYDDDVEAWMPSEEEFDALETVNRWTTQSNIVYEGESVTHHFRPNHLQGVVRVTWPEDEVYFGEMREGKKYGFGRLSMPTGDEYRGQWKDDQPHGVGIYFWEENRTAYAGDFLNGFRQGLGKQTFPDGSRYEGEYKQDQPTGTGTMMKPNGDVYAGEFLEGSFHGKGLMNYADGSEYEGSWKKNRRHSSIGETSRYINTEGDVYHVTFVNDEMDGQGTFLQAKLNPWKLVKHGVWRHGKLSHWVGVSINIESTNEFCSRFVIYGDYSSQYAALVAQNLPELPSGVDPDDRRVEQHVNGILRRAGPLASASVVSRSEKALAEFQPKYDALLETKEAADESLARATKQWTADKEAHDEQDMLYENLSAELENLRLTLKGFWRRGTKEHRLKRSFKRAYKRLRSFDTLEWFACKMTTFTPPLWIGLWRAIAKIHLPELDKRSYQSNDMERLCNSAAINRDYGEHSALLRDYNIKLLDEIAFYNVYERTKQKQMLKEVGSIVHQRDLNPRNSELTQICPLAGPLISYVKAAYNYTVAARPLAEVMEKALMKLDEVEHAKSLLQTRKEQLHTSETKLYECDRAVQIATIELENSKVRLHEIQLNLQRARECQAVAQEAAESERLLHKFTRAEELDDSPIDPWMSREDEVIFNHCLDAIEYMIDLLENVEPEVWDCMWTMKELTVARFQYQEEYQMLEDDPHFVPPEVRDAMGALVNCVAGFDKDGAEIEVQDALNEILYKVQGGPEPEVVEVLDAAITQGVEIFLFEDRAEKRQAKFQGKRVVVTMAPEREGARVPRKFGVCETTYDYDVPIQAPPEPGTGVIYCEMGTTQVYGFEDTCQFLAEIRIGDLLCLPDPNDSAGLVERTVVSIWYDYHLEIDLPFPDELVMEGWTKQWAFRKPDAVLEYVPKQFATVELDEGGTIDVEIEQVELAEEEIQAMATTSGELDSETSDSDDYSIYSGDEDFPLDEDTLGDSTGSARPGGRSSMSVGTRRTRVSRVSGRSQGRRGRRRSSSAALQIWQRFEDEQGNSYWAQMNATDPGITTSWQEPSYGPNVWFQFEDEGTGFYYFFKPSTGETTWIEPTISNSSTTSSSAISK